MARREALQRTIDDRIDDLVAANEEDADCVPPQAHTKATGRDIVLFLCAVLFTIVWWNVSHARANWMLVFIAMIGASVIAAMYAARGSRRALRQAIRRNDGFGEPDIEQHHVGLIGDRGRSGRAARCIRCREFGIHESDGAPDEKERRPKHKPLGYQACMMAQ